MQTLLRKFWADDSGALLAAEWLCLASLTVLGVAAGAGTVRNTISSEFDQFNRSLQTYGPTSVTIPAVKSQSSLATAPSANATLPRLTGGDLPIF